MKRKLPRNISVGGHKFSIVVKPIDGENWGEMHFDERKIYISPECLGKPGKVYDILRHELIHASLAVSGVGFAERFDEESVVRAIDHIFFPAWTNLEPKIKDYEN